MYLRIMNQLDVTCMGEAICSEINNPIVSGAVLERVSHSIAILDNSYGENRKAFDMGGYVFLLTNPHDSEKIKSQILDCYGLFEENSEYSEEICKGSKQEIWLEEMYLRGSDDAVVLIYAKEAGTRENTVKEN